MMGFYVYFNGFLTAMTLEHPQGTPGYEFYQFWLYINKVGYSVLIIIIGKLYKSQSHQFTDIQNFQF
jgi:hypothetical protein